MAGRIPDYSNLTAFFTGCYAGITIVSGWVIDRIGTKLGLALSLVVWSVFGMLNAFAGRMVAMHILIRSAFGIGEGGNFPASIKTVAEWFPKRERALATSIFNSGTNVGAMIASLFVPWCLVHYGYARGWKMAFILTGAVGFIWLIFWFWLYDTPASQKRLSAEEYEHILSDNDTESPEDKTVYTAKIPWWKLLRYRQTWAFFWGKFLTDGVWWFYLFWLPDYFRKQFGMTTEQVRLPTFLVYGVSIVGSIYGGIIPLKFIRKGMSVYRARMRAMLIISVFPLSVLSTQYFGNVAHFGQMAAVLACGTICIAAAAHQAWSANLFTTVSDMFPKKSVGTVTGIGAMAGGVGGVLVQKVCGFLTDAYVATPQVAYGFMFLTCAVSYLVAWVVIKYLVPRHTVITDL